MAAQGPAYGLDHDLKVKQDAKYDVGLETKVMTWIEEILGKKRDGGSIQEWFKDGQILCELINKIVPGTVKKVNTSAMPFKQMENITYFTTAARNLGVHEGDMFGTPDLYEDKNMGAVMATLYAFGGAVQKSCPSFDGPKLGVATGMGGKDAPREKKAATQMGGYAGTMEKVEHTTAARQVAGAGAGGHAGAGAQYVSAPGAEGANATGLDADLKAKQAAKFDTGLESEVCAWIEKVTGEARGDQNTAEWLKDGKVLCHLANKIKPDSIKKVNEQKMPFKQMENITNFMNVMRDIGVPEASMFGTPDLYEEKNMGSVMNAIYTLGGVVQVQCPDFTGPKLGLAQKVSAAAHDKKRASGMCVNQSEGLQANTQVERPKNTGITSGHDAGTKK